MYVCMYQSEGNSEWGIKGRCIANAWGGNLR